MKLANANSHVVLDADAWLVDDDVALATLRHTAPDTVGAVQVFSQYEQKGQLAVAPSWLTRVLCERWPGSVRYTGRVHEQAQHGLRVKRVPVRVRHDGYCDESLACKAGRNAALLTLELSDRLDDSYVWYQLGKDHDVYARHGEALAVFDRALASVAGLSALSRWLHGLTVRKLHAHKRLAQYDQGLLWARMSLRDWSHSLDLFFALGDLLLDWAAEDPMQATVLVPLIEEAWRTLMRLGENPGLDGAVAGRGTKLAAGNLALLYDLLEQPVDAQAMRELTREMSNA